MRVYMGISEYIWVNMSIYDHMSIIRLYMRVFIRLYMRVYVVANMGTKT